VVQPLSKIDPKPHVPTHDNHQGKSEVFCREVQKDLAALKDSQVAPRRVDPLVVDEFRREMQLPKTPSLLGSTVPFPPFYAAPTVLPCSTAFETAADNAAAADATTAAAAASQKIKKS